MSYIDLKYIGIVSPRLEKFAKKKDYLYNFRCPYCGDSKRNKNRARGFFFLKKSDMMFKCHNCGVGRNLANFLKDMDVTIHDEYVMERFKNGTTGKGTNTPNPKFEFEKPEFSNHEQLSKLEKISELNKLHPAIKYLASRSIPEKYYSVLYYAEDFNTWAKTGSTYKEDRIVIPLLDPNSKMFGYQGRALNKLSKLRYITTILDDSYPKVYGLDRVNPNEKIYVTEGPFDSLFLGNSIAMVGSDLDCRSFGWSDYIYVYDNEPRNREIVNRIAKSIDRGDQVVIWPSNVYEKDINDMVLAGLDVNNMVQSNYYSGIEANIKFNHWKKV